MNLSKIYEDFIISRRILENQIDVPFECHHIIPKCLKGNDSPSNLINLKPGDHLFAHIILAKIYGGRCAIAAQFMLDNERYSGRRSRLRYESIRTKVRIAKLGNNYASATKGIKKHSEEFKARMRGNTFAKGCRGGAKNKGRKDSPQTIEKKRLARLGKPSNSKGCKWSQESKAKRSAATKGKPWSAERRATYEARRND